MVGDGRVDDVKHPKSPSDTMFQEVRGRGDETMDSDILLGAHYYGPPMWGLGGQMCLYTLYIYKSHAYRCIP